MSDFDNVWQQVQNNLSIAEDVSAILDEAAKNHRQQITKICAERDAAVALGKRLAIMLYDCNYGRKAIPEQKDIDALLAEARTAGWLED